MKHLKNLILKKAWILYVASCLSLSSCASVTPVTNERKTIAYDGNEETAGIIGSLPGGSIEISSSARDRFNSLVERYGDKTIPVTDKDFGVEELGNGNYSITKESCERWYKMKLMDERERIDKSDKIFNL